MSEPIDLGREFEEAGLGDERRNRRAEFIVESLAQDPALSFPAAFHDPAELEGFYRFASNTQVDADKLIGGHARKTAQRIEADEDVLVIHDTTKFAFDDGIEREGLGIVKKGNKKPGRWKSKSDIHGFYGHFSLVVGAHDQCFRPLGVVSLIPTNRMKQRTKTKKKLSGAECSKLTHRESERWLKGVKLANERLTDVLVPNRSRIVHVMDREGDIYWLLQALIRQPEQFVIRANHNRKLLVEGEDAVLRDALDQTVHAKLKRSVPINARAAKPFAKDNKKHPPREERVAKLEVRAFKVRLRPPPYHSDKAGLDIHLVWVHEPEPPEGQSPVEWLLYTKKPIVTKDDVASVVDAYCARWLIEEYFKAIKTGCQYQKRQLQSYDALLVALAIFVPIAVKLLELRYWARAHPDEPATTVLSITQLDVLTTMRPKWKINRHSTIRTALLAIASLGGHLKSNGEPGWLVLRRGLEKLLQAEAVWLAARAEM